MSFGLGLSSVAKLNTDGVQKLDFRPISREILETEKVVRQLLSAVVAKFEWLSRSRAVAYISM